MIYRVKRLLNPTEPLKVKKNKCLNVYLIETKAILFAAFPPLSHLTFLADQGFIQDFWRGGGGGIYWCINEAQKRDTDCTDFSIISQIVGGGIGSWWGGIPVFLPLCMKPC